VVIVADSRGSIHLSPLFQISEKIQKNEKPYRVYRVTLVDYGMLCLRIVGDDIPLSKTQQ
jgi:hypothetical protein